MQRSSDTIGAIAAAIAKAQTELTNPEKSLTAVIHSPFPRESARSFRYASLASGLDLVRKALGKHEVAIVQSTTIDWEARLIRLTTTLAHSSGEWLASDWPVCAVGDAETPHKLGTALTYARRYGLFTLVGIAGEDDLDAPDLAPSASPPALNHQASNAPMVGTARIPSATATPASHPQHVPRRQTVSPKPVFAPSESAAARDELLAQLLKSSADGLTDWARATLPVKNRLQPADADAVNDAFTIKLGDISPATDEFNAQSHSDQPNKVDKSVLTLSEPRRLRDKNHLRLVAARSCLACGRQPSDPHHLKFAQPRAMARKVSDEFVVPLCRVHHRQLHQRGDEREWWAQLGIDPLPVAAALWSETRGLAIETTASDTSPKHAQPIRRKQPTSTLQAGE